MASFGIRRGSAKDQGHDHLPSDIFVGPGFARLLGQCPKSLADWIAELQRKNIIPNDSDPSDAEPGEAQA